MLKDARAISDGSQLEFDVCVVGGGPAGIALVRRLSGHGLTICLLESGGTELESRQQDLLRGEIVGHPYFALHSCRFGLLGGSSRRWGGWCLPLESQDFEQRDWVPHSGWPIAAGDLEPYYAETARFFGLPNDRFHLGAWTHRVPPPIAFDGSDFAHRVVQYSMTKHLGEAHSEDLRSSEDVTVLVHAPAVDLRLAEGSSRLESVHVRTLDGRTFGVSARAVVLAAGGIENPRMLLAARADRARGLGNEHDQVGRCFMEHLHIPCGHLMLESGIDNGFYRVTNQEGARLRGVVMSHPDAQRRHRLLGTSIGIEDASYHYGTPFLGWPPALSLMYWRLLHTGAAAWSEHGKNKLIGLYNTSRAWQTRRAASQALRRLDEAGDRSRIRSLYFRSEQAPNPASRVLLSEGRDALGVPRPRLDWRIARADTESISGWLDRLDAVVRERRLGRVIRPVDGWQEHLIGGPHHMGTTRMSSAPEHGVVDGNCRVHSVDNLYVAGSSVFTTGGFANPTFTLVALALRLADHLQAGLRG